MCSDSYLDIQAPAFSKPSDSDFYSRKDPSKPDIAFLKNHFIREGRITEEQALYIIRKGTEILKREPNLLEVDAPITGTFTTASVSLSDVSLWRYSWPIL